MVRLTCEEDVRPMVLHLPGDHKATTVGDAVIEKNSTSRLKLRKSSAWGQGDEGEAIAESLLRSPSPRQSPGKFDP